MYEVFVTIQCESVNVALKRADEIMQLYDRSTFTNSSGDATRPKYVNKQGDVIIRVSSFSVENTVNKLLGKA